MLAKGPNFVFSRDYIQKQYGLPIWETMMAHLSIDAADVWQAAEIDQEYPFVFFKEGVAALSQSVGLPGELEIAEMYMYIADRSLNTIYKAFFQLTSPTFVLKNFPRLWDRFFTVGEVEVAILGEKQAQLTFTLPEIFLDWLPAACLGYSRKAVEMAGGNHLVMQQVTKAQVTDGSWQVSYKLSWT